MSFWSELKRRNVFRVALAYVVSAWVIIEVSSLILDIFGSPDSVKQIIVALLVLGLPFAMLFAWVFEVTPEGIKREEDIESQPLAKQHTARRLEMLTIAMVIIALVFLAADRFTGKPTSEVNESPAQQTASAAGNEQGRDVLWATRQLLEVDRLRDLGKNNEAFALAREVAPLLGEGYDEEALWAGISYPYIIDSRPTGARVYVQQIDADLGTWEELGMTPLENVRFPASEAWRVRLDLDGHRSVEVLQDALWGAEWRGGIPPLRPVPLDPVDDLPADMVRIPGFTHDLVEYGDFFMDRFEVTNHDYAAFVAGGGYTASEYWTEPFVRDSQEVPLAEALSSFVDRTGRPGPSTWSGGAYPSGQGDHPVGGLSWYEALAYARFNDKTLPTVAHLRQAMAYYRDNSGYVTPRSNFNTSGPWPVGTNRAVNTLGLYDLIGNLREWCWNSVEDSRRCTMGAAWNDAPYNVSDIEPKSPWDRDPNNGFRLVRTFDGEEKLARLRQPEPVPIYRDYMSEVPASDAEFEIYLRMYAYDEQPLNAEIVAVDRFDYWTRERVEFDLPSGQRGAAMLYIPNNVSPPYETIVYWPGSDVVSTQSIDAEYLNGFDFLMKSGRAVAQPIFFGAFDRDDPRAPFTHMSLWYPPENTNTTRRRDLHITWLRELSRTLDYLEERDDIKTRRLGFYGFSWGGGCVAPIVLTVEADRFHAAVLNVGGLESAYRFLPEVDGINFVTRVRTPVLMINGEFDPDVPYETSQIPTYELLGTEAAHKKLVTAPTAHLVPHDILIKESLDWFDRYLGDSGY